MAPRSTIDGAHCPSSPKHAGDARLRDLVALGLSLLAVSGCGLVLDLSASPSRTSDDGGIDGSDSGRDRPMDGEVARVDARIADDARVADANAAADVPAPPDAGPPPDGAPLDDGGSLLRVGAACADDRDCSSGYCYDVNVANPYCYGRICTVGCRAAEDCMMYASAAGGSAASDSCVLHTVGADLVCDFSTGFLPGAAIRCE
jgi:hypothetical protein